MSKWQAYWDNLPDPRDSQAPAGRRCTVVMSEQSWKHIVKKHVGSVSEPWAEWLSPALRDQLLTLWEADSSSSSRDQILHQASALLQTATRQCLERPLALLYERSAVKQSKRRWAPTWLLVLPVGAVLVIRQVGRRPLVITCYFPHVSCRTHKPWHRWRKVVSLLVARYASWGAAGLALPGPDASPTIGPEIVARQIRFVTPHSWGFRPDLDGCPWRGRLAPWPAEPASQPAVRRRLKPRRLPKEDLYDEVNAAR